MIWQQHQDEQEEDDDGEIWMWIFFQVLISQQQFTCVSLRLLRTDVEVAALR